MEKERRIVHKYYYKQQLFFSIGYVQYLAAFRPLAVHDHKQMTEFVYMERGSQTYRTDTKDYLVKQGEVFFTHPGEPHGTGAFPEEVSSLYYLIIDLSLLSKLNLFTDPEEYVQIQDYFSRINSRIFKASADLPLSLRQLVKCFDTADNHFDTRIRNALSQVLLDLSIPFTKCASPPAEAIGHSLSYIQEHLTEVIRVSDLPPLDHLSLPVYNKLFVQAMGLPPGEYIQKQKIEKTKELLTGTDLSITEIAHQYGFSSSQYFSTVFKRFCYVTPSQYRTQGHS